MQVAGTGAASYAAGSGVTQNKKSATNDNAFAALLKGGDPAALLREITKDGMKSLWDWEIKKLREKVAQEVMQEHNLTPEKISAMGDKQRAEVQDMIMKEVERRVKQMIADDMEKKKSGLLAADMSSASATSEAGELLDIAV